MLEKALIYRFSCPNCAGAFSIEVDKIPTVASHLRCPSCGHSIEFPTREEARGHASLLDVPAGSDGPVGPPAARQSADLAAGASPEAAPAPAIEGPRYRILKVGFEKDVYDRRALRNLIRAGEIHDADRIRVDEAEPVRASSLPYLKPLFDLRKTNKTKLPQCCRAHTDRIAFFQCSDTGRPLCEDCAELKKFGGTTIRVCHHCGGTCKELPHA